jgi:VWFA-related protein
VQTNQMPTGRIVLIFMDERIDSSPFTVQKAKQIAHTIVDQLSSDDVAGVAFMINHGAAQEFTTDRARLHQAIDKYYSAFTIRGQSATPTLRDLAAHLASLPERRKVMIYIGWGEPYDVKVLATTQMVCTTVCTQPATLGSDVMNTQYRNLMSLFDVAQRANVNLYTIDPSGLLFEVANPVKRAYAEYLRITASNTGGRAVVNHNMPEMEVPAILRENASYYLIGIKRPDAGAAGRYRRLQVKVARPRVDVRTRTGYVEPHATPAVERARVTELRRMIPDSSVPISLWAEAVAAGKTRTGDRSGTDRGIAEPGRRSIPGSRTTARGCQTRTGPL